MKRFFDIYKQNGTLYGITTDCRIYELKPGNKFKLNKKRYRVGHEGNYFADIPCWEHCWVTRKLADLFIGKRNYDY